MNDMLTEEQNNDLTLEFTLDAPPEKVWRAISMPELREKWLPKGDLAGEALYSAPGEEVCYRMRDQEPPYLESIVTLRISPYEPDRTLLRITHSLEDQRLKHDSQAAANDNPPDLMCAA